MSHDDRKRAIGSALHEAIEIDLDGELDEESIDPSVAPYFAGWRKFQDEHGAFLIQAKERPIYSRTYRYGCTPDLWGNFLAGGEAVPFVCEIKSTATVHPAVGLQTAAQLRCIAETAYPDAIEDRKREAYMRRARRFVLQLLPTGKYSLRELTARDDFATFLALLTAYRWKQRHNIAL